MFCPKCRQEYIDGTNKCDECNTDLINVLSEENNSINLENIQFEQILSTANHANILLIKSLLDSNRIIYYFYGDNTNNTYNKFQYTQLMVEKVNVKKAKELLKDLNLKYYAP